MAKSLLQSLLQVSFLLNIVKALETLQPTSAGVQQLDSGANPVPTPRAILAEGSNLLRRSYYNTLCGYINGNINYPLSCVDSGYVCATASHYNAAGCCNPNKLANCTLPSTCIPYGGICDAACQASNIEYTSCGYLAPYCLTKVFEYGRPFYEYDCATTGGVLTVLTFASGLSQQNVVTSVAVVTHTIDMEVSATPASSTGGSGGSVTYNCGDNSNCGNGNNNSGNDNGVNNKSAAPMRIAAFSFRLLTLLCTVVFEWL